MLNELPILRPKTISSPFKKRWQNILLFVLLPLNLIVYIRSIRAKVKLATDLTKVEAKTRQIMHYINQENL